MLQAKAKAFWSGPSQAARLPEAFRLATKKVTLKKVGHALIPEPAAKRKWPNGHAASFAHMPADFRRPRPLPSSPFSSPAFIAL